VSYAYDAAGNFTAKSDFSTTAANAYTYTGGACGGGPNAVKSVALAAAQGGGIRNYCYDARKMRKMGRKMGQSQLTVHLILCLILVFCPVNNFYI
jgi:hypothetical protein